MARQQRHDTTGAGAAVPAPQIRDRSGRPGRPGTTSTRGGRRPADDGDTGSAAVVNRDMDADGPPPALLPPPHPDPGALDPGGTSDTGSPGGAGGTGGPGSTGSPGGTGGPSGADPGPGGADAGSGAAGDVLGAYLRGQATAFLRALGLRGDADGQAEPQLARSARRLSGALRTYAPLVDEAWAEPLRTELGWLAATLGREPEYTGRLDRLLEALRRLSAADEPPALGAARAAALLERQLTLARTRAHSATLQAMGSSRFHALADAVAVLASEVPLTPAAARPAAEALPPLAAAAHARLADAAAALPLHRAGHPYNAEAVQAALGADLAADLQDAPWHQVRVLLRLARYAAEVPGAGAGDASRLAEASALLTRHYEAAECASAVAAAARTPRIAPATAYALGVLHADQRHEVEAARFAFSRLWQPLPEAGDRAEGGGPAGDRPAGSRSEAGRPRPAGRPGSAAGAAPQPVVPGARAR